MTCGPNVDCNFGSAVELSSISHIIYERGYLFIILHIYWSGRYEENLEICNFYEVFSLY